MGGRTANLIANDPANLLLKLVPWGGVAVCVYNSEDDKKKEDGETAIVKHLEGSDVSPETRMQLLKAGSAYCFLPLPVRTGLPIMVNGFFELSSNRRDVWQA